MAVPLGCSLEVPSPKLPRHCGLVGVFAHAPTSDHASAKFFRPHMTSPASWARQKEFRNNPFTGTFHTAPAVYSDLHAAAGRQRTCPPTLPSRKPCVAVAATPPEADTRKPAAVAHASDSPPFGPLSSCSAASSTSPSWSTASSGSGSGSGDEACSSSSPPLATWGDVDLTSQAVVTVGWGKATYTRSWQPQYEATRMAIEPDRWLVAAAVATAALSPLLPTPAAAGHVPAGATSSTPPSTAAHTRRPSTAVTRTRKTYSLGVQTQPLALKVADVYDVGKVVGTGTFATVKFAEERAPSRRPVAIKFIRKRFLYSQAERESVQREASILTLMDHPNVIRLRDVFEDDDFVCLVLDRAEGGSLHDFISRKAFPKCGEDETRHLLAQVLDALVYIHEQGVIHGDIKPENIILGREILGRRDGSVPPLGVFDVVRVCDFGNARRARDPRYWKVTGSVNLVPFEALSGTLGYMAPEIMRKEAYNTLCDSWSLGVLMYQMLCGHHPFKPYNKCLEGPPDFDSRIWGGVSATAKSLCRGLLSHDPARRLTSMQARAHPWFHSNFHN